MLLETKTCIFPNLHSALLSVGQLCDSDCTVTFDKNKVLVYNKDKALIATGFRDSKTRLWKIPLPISHHTNNNSPSLALANGIIKRDTPISDLCEFLHASLFSPTQSTLENAIKNGFLNSFPGLTLKTVRKYLQLEIDLFKSDLGKIIAFNIERKTDNKL